VSEWDQIESRLPEALDWLFSTFVLAWNNQMEVSEEWDEFVADAQARYERGRAQHSESASTWDDWTDDEFVANIREELLDAVIYAAMRGTKNAQRW
jgi:hypothetical protein